MNLPLASQGSVRPPPENPEAEQALLGALMHNAAAADRVRDFLAPEHFSEPAHGRIYSAALKLVDQGAQPTPIALRPIFEADEALKAVGGWSYLARLAGAAVTLYEVEHYGRQIVDLARLRRLIEIGHEMVERAHDMEGDLDAPAQLELAEAELYALAERNETRGFVAMEKAVAAAMSYAEKAARGELHSVTTGIRSLDRALSGGLHDSDLIILGARPGMGKTALAGGIAQACARAAGSSNGGPVAFFSLEMSDDQLATRLTAAEAGINSEWLRSGVDDAGARVSGQTLRQAGDAATRLQSLPIHIDDTPALSVAQVRTRARRLKRRKGLGLIVVDYLQLMKATGGRRNDNRVADVTEISMGLKAIAKELNVPVLALSQLSRQLESREDKRPQLADLRESGSIEQDADVVIFLYREEYYRARSEPAPNTKEHAEWQIQMDGCRGLAEALVRKNRHGAARNVRLQFEATLTRFGELARPEDERFL